MMDIYERTARRIVDQFGKEIHFPGIAAQDVASILRDAFPPQPSPTLTPELRKAIEAAVSDIADGINNDTGIGYPQWIEDIILKHIEAALKESPHAP